MDINALVAIPLGSLAELQLSAEDSLGTFAAAACLLEASAIKAGNVHPHASFQDMEYSHFRKSAETVGRTVDQYFHRDGNPTVGKCIHELALATKHSVGVNTNLGTLILLGPLLLAAKSLAAKGFDASRCSRQAFQQSVASILKKLDHSDSKWIYKSIALVNPGGLGKSQEMDAHASPPESILDAMRFAQAKDDVAKQWVTDFEIVFSLANRLDHSRWSHTETIGTDWLRMISDIQIEYLSNHIDSLIARKNGTEVASEVKHRAFRLNGLRMAKDVEFDSSWREFDAFLRADGHRLNPGTTADLIVAAMFVALIFSASQPLV